MHTEQAVLCSATGEGVESLRRPFRCHQWFPLTEGTALDLDFLLLPRAFGHRAAVERLSRLRPGRELGGLWNLLSRGQPGEFGWVHLDEGPSQWQAEITRRPPE